MQDKEAQQQAWTAAERQRDQAEELAELTRHAAPEDHARLKRTIQLVSLARRAVTQARERLQRAEIRLEAAQDTTAHRQSQSRDLIAKVHFPGDCTSK